MRTSSVAVVLACLFLLGGVAAAQQSDLEPGEANVIDVDWLERDGGDITFWVTIYKDIEGRQGETDWWQLEQLDGTAIGRHDIASQSEPQFTTQDTFAVPDDVRYIVVRGHDSRYLYGGRAIVIDLGGGGTAQYDQGADEDDLSSSSSGGGGEGGTSGGGGGGGIGGNDTTTDDGPLVPADPEQFDETQENDTDGLLSNETGPGLPGGSSSPLLPVALIAFLAVAAVAYAVWRDRHDHS